jgi:hypothetical protein
MYRLVALSVGAALLGSCSLLFSAEESPASDAAPIDAGVPNVEDGPSPDADISIWEKSERPFRIRFSITNPETESLEFFPVLLIVKQEDIPGVSMTELRNLTLLRNGAVVPIQTESSASASQQVFWFRTDIGGDATVGYQLYFGGNTGAEAGGAVWGNYDAVWHLSPPTTGSPNMTPNAVAAGAPAILAPEYGPMEGIAGEGAMTNGTTVAMTMDPLSFYRGSCMSASAWVKPVASASMATQSPIDSIRSSAEQQPGYRLSHRTAPGMGPVARFADKQSGFFDLPPDPQPNVAPDEWHQIAVTLQDDTELQLYVDGEPADAPVEAPAMGVRFEGDQLWLGHNLEGDMDEVRISKKCFSEAWVGAEYSSIMTPWPVLMPHEELPPDAGS